MRGSGLGQWGWARQQGRGAAGGRCEVPVRVVTRPGYTARRTGPHDGRARTAPAASGSRAHPTLEAVPRQPPVWAGAARGWGGGAGLAPPRLVARPGPRPGVLLVG